MKYHPQVGLPAHVKLPRGAFLLVPTKHARDAAKEEGLDIPAYLDTRNAEVFEVVCEQGSIQKIGFRLNYDTWRDLCMVVTPGRSGAWRVVTVWGNHVDDHHETLRKGEYATA